MMLLIAIVMVIEIVFIIYSVIKLIEVEIELGILEFEINAITKELECKKDIKRDFENEQDVGSINSEAVKNFCEAMERLKKEAMERLEREANCEKYKSNSGKRKNRYARNKYGI